MVQNVLEYSRILCYVLVFSGMFWYDMLCSGVFLNVLEGSENFPGWWWVVCCDYSVISDPALLNLDNRLNRRGPLSVLECSRMLRKVCWVVGGML